MAVLEQETQKTNIILERKLLREVRIAAAEDERSMSDIIGEALAQYLKSRKARQPRGS